MKLQQMVGAAEWSVLSISERTPEGKCRECSYSCTSGIKRYYASRCIRKRAPQDYRRVQASPWFDACDLRRQLFCEAQAKLLENVFTTLKTKLVPTNFCRVFVHQLYRQCYQWCPRECWYSEATTNTSIRIKKQKKQLDVQQQLHLFGLPGIINVHSNLVHTGVC